MNINYIKIGQTCKKGLKNNKRIYLKRGEKNGRFVVFNSKLKIYGGN